MKKAITLAAFVLIFVAGSSAQGTCVRHSETSGGFSYCPPSGWSSRDSQSGPYKSFATPEGSVLKANMNMKSETTSVSHDVYIGAALRHLLDGNEAKGAEARKVIGWTKFTTDSNLAGSRMVYETSYRGMLLRTVQIILDLPGKKLILTGTSLVSDKDTTDKIFDAVARSIALNR